MTLMERMMKPVIGWMSIEEKQAMMLKMMPMMMEDVNMADTMLKMVPEMLDHVSLLDLLKVLKKLFPKFLQGVNTVQELLPKLAERLPALIERILPVIEALMPSIMVKLMPVMMAKDTMKRMETLPERMLPKMLENDQLRQLMPEMMSRMMPHCLEQMLPAMPEEQKAEFVSTMQRILGNKEESL
jgi:hypothetical protein